MRWATVTAWRRSRALWQAGGREGVSFRCAASGEMVAVVGLVRQVHRSTWDRRWARISMTGMAWLSITGLAAPLGAVWRGPHLRVAAVLTTERSDQG